MMDKHTYYPELTLVINGIILPASEQCHPATIAPQQGNHNVTTVLTNHHAHYTTRHDTRQHT